jgi:hypothetical protein
MNYLASRGEIDANTASAVLRDLVSAPLQPGATLDDFDGFVDPILEEALAIAKDIIARRMAAEGLPVPKGIDTHAKALVDAMPDLREKARLRVEARYRAAAEALAGVG